MISYEQAEFNKIFVDKGKYIFVNPGTKTSIVYAVIIRESPMIAINKNLSNSLLIFIFLFFLSSGGSIILIMTLLSFNT